MMGREYYTASIASFRASTDDEILGALTRSSQFAVEQAQRDAWLAEIAILRDVLTGHEGRIYFEYAIPRMGKRIDVVLLIESVVFVLEFKVGEKEFTGSALDQVCDYGLDLKNFHEPSHDHFVAPILIATGAKRAVVGSLEHPRGDKLLSPIRCGVGQLSRLIEDVLSFARDDAPVDAEAWGHGRYCPTPTIIEAALALYKGHSVAEISRNDATAINLGRTAEAISGVIHRSRDRSFKSICFVTGVPGAGKTLVGLNTATRFHDKEDDLYSVFLSGNGPLVMILREALARDHVRNERDLGRKVSKAEARSKVGAFIQNVHHFRDDCLRDGTRPPIEHVVIFDEAQRAWNREQTSKFMLRKRNTPGFGLSEPEFLISCLDRHADWATIVCLVGGGQEINTGEAGIAEWIASLNRSFPGWHIHISSRLSDSEYGAGEVVRMLSGRPNVAINDDLHLSVSMRSFRAEDVSGLVKQLLDLEASAARDAFESVKEKYPIRITRDLSRAKRWLRHQARGSERYGIVASSQAERLKPHAIDVRAPMDPIHWFLDGKEDVRSSYYLEDVGTEFHVQGLELDWTCVTWDADFRYSSEGWEHWSFTGDRWNRIRKPERQVYLKNAYRVLLTRARQGMIIVVPPGDPDDPTRRPEFYDPTFHYLRELGFECIE